MHKKGITEEVAKKRSRRTVKHQRGIVGADLATIAAKRNQTAAVRQQQRLVAITKAKSEKKEKEVKKAKVTFIVVIFLLSNNTILTAGHTCKHSIRPQGIEAADEGWQKWTMSYLVWIMFVWTVHAMNRIHVMPCTSVDMAWILSSYRARPYENRTCYV
jgi:large subunit ribosomal protein L24e